MATITRRQVLTRRQTREFSAEDLAAINTVLADAWREVVLPREAKEVIVMRRREDQELVEGEQRDDMDEKHAVGVEKTPGEQKEAKALVPEAVAREEAVPVHAEDVAPVVESKEAKVAAGPRLPHPREQRRPGLRAVLKVPDEVIWGYQAPLRSEASNHKRAARKPIAESSPVFVEKAFSEHVDDKEAEDMRLATGHIPYIYLDDLFTNPDQEFRVADGRSFVFIARGLRRALRRLYNEEDMRFGGLNEAGFKSLILGMLSSPDDKDKQDSPYEIISEPTAYTSTTPSIHGDLLVIHKTLKRAWLIELKYLAMPFATPYERHIAQDQRGRNKGIHRRAQRFMRRFRFIMSEQYMAAYANQPTHATWRVFTPMKQDKAKPSRELTEDEEDPGDHADDVNYFKPNKPVMRVGEFCLKALEQNESYTSFKVKIGEETVEFKKSKGNLRYAAVVGFAHWVCVATDAPNDEKSVYTDVMTAEDLECPEEHVHLPHKSKRNVYVAQEGTSLQEFQAAWAGATDEQKQRLMVLQRIDIEANRTRMITPQGTNTDMPKTARTLPVSDGMRRRRGLRFSDIAIS